MLTSVFDIRSAKIDDYEDGDLDDDLEGDESLYEQYLTFRSSGISKRDTFNYEACVEEYVEDGDESCLCNLLQGRPFIFGASNLF